MISKVFHRYITDIKELLRRKSVEIISRYTFDRKIQVLNTNNVITNKKQMYEMIFNKIKNAYDELDVCDG